MGWDGETCLVCLLSTLPLASNNEPPPFPVLQCDVYILPDVIESENGGVSAGMLRYDPQDPPLLEEEGQRSGEKFADVRAAPVVASLPGWQTSAWGAIRS